MSDLERIWNGALTTPGHVPYAAAIDSPGLQLCERQRSKSQSDGCHEMAARGHEARRGVKVVGVTNGRAVTDVTRHAVSVTALAGSATPPHRIGWWWCIDHRA